MEKMRAALLYGLNDLKKIRIEEVEKPKAGPSEIVARVKVAPTCGSDVKAFVRGHHELTAKFPAFMGHEGAGEIVEVGKGVTNFKFGDRITTQRAHCLKCYYCKKRKYAFCTNPVFDRWGFREYILIHSPVVQHSTFKIPDGISYEEAAQLEPLSCAVNGIDKCRISIGDAVAIIGSGSQGLYFTQLAKLDGATKVIVSGHHDFRLNLAKKLGADEVINAHRENVEKRVKELTDGRGADVVIEAVGRPETYEAAFKLVASGGLVNLYAGAAAGTTMTIETAAIHYGDLTVVGTNDTTPFHIQKAWELIVNGAIDVKSLITQRMTLDEVPKAFEILTTTKDTIKIAITP